MMPSALRVKEPETQSVLIWFNVEGDQAWAKVGKPGDTRQVLAAARALRDEE